MALPEANAGGANFPTASRQSARLVKASSEARQIERFQAHRRIRTSDTEVASPNRVSGMALVLRRLDSRDHIVGRLGVASDQGGDNRADHLRRPDGGAPPSLSAFTNAFFISTTVKISTKGSEEPNFYQVNLA